MPLARRRVGPNDDARGKFEAGTRDVRESDLYAFQFAAVLKTLTNEYALSKVLSEVLKVVLLACLVILHRRSQTQIWNLSYRLDYFEARELYREPTVTLLDWNLVHCSTALHKPSNGLCIWIKVGSEGPSQNRVRKLWKWLCGVASIIESHHCIPAHAPPGRCCRRDQGSSLTWNARDRSRARSCGRWPDNISGQYTIDGWGSALQ